MPYRVRARLAKRARYTFDYETQTRTDTWDRDEYRALREPLIAAYSAQLDLIEAFWRHEPGIPDHLRVLPEFPDPRVLIHGDAAIRATFEAALTAHEAILASRSAYLVNHPPL